VARPHVGRYRTVPLANCPGAVRSRPGAAWAFAILRRHQYSFRAVDVFCAVHKVQGHVCTMQRPVLVASATPGDKQAIALISHHMPWMVYGPGMSRGGLLASWYRVGVALVLTMCSKKQPASCSGRKRRATPPAWGASQSGACTTMSSAGQGGHNDPSKSKSCRPSNSVRWLMHQIIR
jgi:hypothetical protein